MGIEVEKEHTDNLIQCARIALDHLEEDPIYYTKLTNDIDMSQASFYIILGGFFDSKHMSYMAEDSFRKAIEMDPDNEIYKVIYKKYLKN